MGTASGSSGKLMKIIGAVVVIGIVLGAKYFFDIDLTGESKDSPPKNTQVERQPDPQPVEVEHPPRPIESSANRATTSAKLLSAIRNQQSDVIVTQEAEVIKTLPDDNEGSRHQRFIVRIPSGDTILIAHNIDLAPRVPLREGDTVKFKGEYEWNDKGGVVHWTHHDPKGWHEDGWIVHDGKEYK